jgi:UDP-2,3-diacylglucosamine pyrophosphatase LpxH
VATIKQIDGVAYMNCGDWVESATALVEHVDGRFETVTWSGDGQDTSDN